MTDRASARISTRKEPKQARSTGLMADVLEAARQVLERVGAQRFTTARVAERAGVSVGSLYQYFPNKAAILFRLQTDEWRDTETLLQGILCDRTRSPPERLRVAVHAFVRSECEEATMRGALEAAAPLHRASPEAKAPQAAGLRIMQAFLDEALPHAADGTRRLAADLIATTLSQVGEHISENRRTEAEVAAYAEALALMLCGYLQALAGEAG